MSDNNMGNRIRELRLSNNLTLEQVAAYVGVGKSTVRKWETGMIANMKRDKIASLAAVLKTTPAYLMGWDEDKKLNTSPPTSFAPNSTNSNKYNIVKIAARDGSYQEKRLSDEDLAVITRIIDTLPDASDDL